MLSLVQFVGAEFKSCERAQDTGIMLRMEPSGLKGPCNFEVIGQVSLDPVHLLVCPRDDDRAVILDAANLYSKFAAIHDTRSSDRGDFLAHCKDIAGIVLTAGRMQGASVAGRWLSEGLSYGVPVHVGLCGANMSSWM